jgi:hypothetical protein
VEEKWSLDPDKGVVRHENGLAVRVMNGEAMDIVNMPAGVSTRELPRLLKEAVVFHATRKQTPVQKQRPAVSRKTGPRKPTLSLGGRR